jgi:hypothetical protein
LHTILISGPLIITRRRYYTNDFETLPLNSEEPYLSDQAGKWEIRMEEDGHRSGANHTEGSGAATVAAVEASSESPSSNQVLRHVCLQQGVVYRGDRRPISVLGSVGWRDMNVSARFRLEDAAAAGFVVAVRACNLGCQVKVPDDRNQVLPQGTNIQGVYVVWGLDGKIQITNSTYGVVPPSAPDQASTVLGVVPLKLHTWYNVSISVVAQKLTWHVHEPTHTSSQPQTIELPVDGFPAAGQVGIGLIDYGMAAIDDLVVVGDG